MKVVLIPIETKVRDLYGKLLLGYHLTQKGYGVVIGPKHRLFELAAKMGNGLLIGIGFYENFSEAYEKARKSGNLIASMDEEGLVYLDRKTYQTKNLNRKTLSLVDRILCWGESQREDILNYAPDTAERTVVTGNVRMDMLRPPFSALYEEEARTNRAMHGNYFLINSNTSYYNHYLGKDYVIGSLKEKKMIKSPSDEAFYEGWLSYQEGIYKGLLDIAVDLSRRMPDCKVIIRPHPSENIDRWRADVSGLGNIMVENKGSSVPWIMGAKAVIHSGCTTGIEANLLGVPVFSYIPDGDQPYLAQLPNRASIVFSTVESLVNAAVDAFSGVPQKSGEGIQDISNFIGNLKEPAYRQYIREFDKMVISDKHEPSVVIWKLRIHNLYRMVKDLGIRLLKGYDGRYIMHKFGVLNTKEVIKMMDEFSSLGNLGKTEAVSLFQNCFFLKAGN